MCVSVCMFEMNSQTAGWILAKLCRHDPWVLTKVYHPKNSKMSPLVGEKVFILNIFLNV